LYGSWKIYGISQNLDTKDYIMVTQNEYCEKCGEQYYNWCEPCQINNLRQNFANWTSENEKIDNFIQKMQLKIDVWSKIFVWIPYNQFSKIKEIRKMILVQHIQQYGKMVRWSMIVIKICIKGDRMKMFL